MNNNYDMQSLSTSNLIKRMLRQKSWTSGLIMFCFLCFLSAFYMPSLQAQTLNRNIDLKNKTIAEALKAIEQNSNYDFFYNNKQIDVNRRITASSHNKDLAQLLNKIFEGTNVTYKVVDKKIILSTELQNNQNKNSDKVKLISGKVLDEKGNPIIGASVTEADNQRNGVATDIEGRFSIKVKPGATILVTYIGYESARFIVKRNESFYTITLNENSKVLDEVLVVAFGKMKKEAFTGSAGVMKSEELSKAQVTNAADALAGRVAGVQLSNPSAQLGASPSITIRGFGSISSDTQPLIVVDGMPFDGDLNLINPNDIESMTVMKDAASNALYGARGANGVIMITTKRGKSGVAKITVDSKWGVNTNGLSNYKTTNAQQYYETYYKMLYNYYISEDGGSMSANEAHTLANKNMIDPASGVGPGYMVYSVPSGEDFIQQGGVMNSKATLGALYKFNDTQLWLQPDDWEKGRIT
jgi:TonB-dependent SusC/RagA subfamily outer membrane receptor